MMKWRNKKLPEGAPDSDICMVVVPEGPRLEKICTSADILWCQLFIIFMDEMVIINHRHIMRDHDQKVNYFRHFYQNYNPTVH